MNIQQMHIEVNLSTQKIASNVKRKFIPEEIDWILNKMIGRFVKNKIKPDEQTRQGGFQSDAIDLNALRTLLVLNKTLGVYKSHSHSVLSAELPGDYSYLVSDTSGLVRSCDGSYTAASTFRSVNEYLYLLKVSKSTKSAKPFYQNATLTVNGTVVMGPTDFPSGLSDKTMNFELQEIIKNTLLSSPTYRVYWERYKNIYQPETFIFVSATAYSSVTLTFDTDTFIATAKTVTEVVPGNDVSKNYSPNRLLRSDHNPDIATSTFGKSRWESPLSAVQGNTLLVYHDRTFIVNNLVVNYIRKPRTVSLSLGLGCDLPDEFHQDICDWAVEYIKQTINDPNYQLKLGDNQLRRE